MLTINQELNNGRYRITKQFGQGQIVSFYETVDNSLEKNVLLKRISINTNGTGISAEINRRSEIFSAESQFLSQIRHDGFLQIFDYFVENNAQYLVMELVDGNNFSEILKKGEATFAIADTVDWGEQILDALHYLHKKSPPVNYFNLRPANIHLKADGKIKLLATGIGSRPDEIGNSIRSAFNAANVSYAPLELIWQKLDAATKRVILKGYDEESEAVLLQPPDERCDIYSAGASIYQLLTNQCPVDALERSIEILEGKNDPLVAPEQLNPTISIELSDFLTKSLEIRRENRFQSALEMRKELVNAYIKLRERNAQQLRSEVPERPEVPVVKPKQVEPVIQSEIILEAPIAPVITAIAETDDQKPDEKVATNQSKKVPAFGMDLELLELFKEKEEQKPAVPTKDSHQEQLDTAELKANTEHFDHEEWQEEFSEDWKESKLTSEVWCAAPEQDERSDDFKYLLGEARKESKLIKRLSYAAFGMILLGGGLFGMVKLYPDTFTGLFQNISTHAVPAPELQNEQKPEPEMEMTASVEPSDEQNSDVDKETEKPPSESSENFERTIEARPEQIATVKTPNPSKSLTDNKKQFAPLEPVGPAAKKKITVDDLINDN